MKNPIKSAISFVVLSAFVVTILSGCFKSDVKESPYQETLQAIFPDSEETSVLTVAVSQTNGVYGPFFDRTPQDAELSELFNVRLLTTNHNGEAMLNSQVGAASLDIAIGLTDNSAVYTWTLRDDLKFSDGALLNADDVIFTYYALCDPSYDELSNKKTTLAQVNIAGLKNYRTKTEPEIYEKYEALFDKIVAAGRNNTDFTDWTEQQQNSVFADIDKYWLHSINEIIEFVAANYLDDYAEKLIGFSPKEISASDGMKTAFAMVAWGFADMREDTVIMETIFSGTTFDLKDGSNLPSPDIFFAEAYELYGGDSDTFWKNESPDGYSYMDRVMENFIYNYGSIDPENDSNSVNKISGIEKLNDYQVRITISENGYNPLDTYRLGVFIAPLHYYLGDGEYNYENNKFGFAFRDAITPLTAVNAPPCTGAYCFGDDNATFYSNEYYYKGKPQIDNIQITVMDEKNMPDAIIANEVDIAVPLNKSIDIFGDTANVIHTVLWDHAGYGYIGINAANVNVGDDYDSLSSQNLRKAFAIIFAACREAAVADYFGDCARVLPYIFDVPDKNAAVVESLEYFKTAGYIFDGSDDVALIAIPPQGAYLDYEILIPGDGTGDHPCYQLALEAAELLRGIGIELKVVDLQSAAELPIIINENYHEMWAAAWTTATDASDSYGFFHSTETVEIPVYQKINMTLYNAERIDITTIPNDFTAAWGWTRDIEKLELRP